MSPVHVGIDARKLEDGGIGSYIRNTIAAALELDDPPAITAFVEPRHAGRTRWPGAGAREVPVRARKYSLAEHWVLARAAQRAGIEVLHAPHYTLPLGWRGPAVVTIHDLTHIRLAHLFPPGAAAYARLVAGAAARQARVVIVDSSHTRTEVIELLGVPAERTRTIPLGVAATFRPRPADEIEAFCRGRGLPADYVLYVGARRRHKNLDLLIGALAALPAAERPPLVLAGEAWDADHRLARVARDAGVAAAIHFSGPVADDDELALLYGGAALYTQPSLAEGFGLPPLEAMACGVPVLSSDAGALPETLGAAARLLPPRNPGEWAAAIRALLGDRAERDDRVRRGLEHTRSFTWRRTAAATAAAWEAARTRPLAVR